MACRCWVRLIEAIALFAATPSLELRKYCFTVSTKRCAAEGTGTLPRSSCCLHHRTCLCRRCSGKRQHRSDRGRRTRPWSASSSATPRLRYIRICRGRATDRPSGDGGICTEFDLRLQQILKALVVDSYQNDIRLLAADLETVARTGETDKHWSTPPFSFLQVTTPSP